MFLYENLEVINDAGSRADKSGEDVMGIRLHVIAGQRGLCYQVHRSWSDRDSDRRWHRSEMVASV